MRTRFLPASVLLAGLTVASLVGCAASPGDKAPATPEVTQTVGELAPDVDAALDDLIDSGATAVTIDIRDGDERSRGAAGTRSHDDPAPAQPDDQLRIASVTKSMTATIIMQLVESGDLQLDTVVEEVVPGVLDAPSPVTVEQLLNHTSGLPDYLNVLMPDAAAYLATAEREYTAQELVDAAQSLPWVAPPGERFSYAIPITPFWV